MRKSLIAIVSLMALFSAACSSTSSGTASSSEADVAESAGLDLAFQGYSTVLEQSAALQLAGLKIADKNKMARVMDHMKSAMKNAIVIAEATCIEPTLPTITGTAFSGESLTGAMMGTNGSGSCALSGDTAASEDQNFLGYRVKMDCNSLQYTDTVDGGSHQLGLDGIMTEELDIATDGVTDAGAVFMEMLSNDLVMSIDGDDFDVIYNLGFLLTTADSTTFTFEADGCLSVGGVGFSISGSETFTE